MKLTSFFILHGVMAVGYALAFFVTPGPLIAYYGIAPSVEGIFMSRFFGIGLLGIGLITCLARNAAETEAGRSIVLALVITYGIGVILALSGTLFGPFNALGWIATGLNLLLGLGFGYFQFIKPIPVTR